MVAAISPGLANYEENLMIFYKQTKPILMTCLYLFMLPWQRHIRQHNYHKIIVCVINLLSAIFGDRGIKGF